MKSNHAARRAVTLMRNAKPQPPSPDLTAAQKADLGHLFAVAPEYVSLIAHPHRTNASAIAIAIVAGLETPRILANELNRIFGTPPAPKDRPSADFAFTGRADHKRFLGMSVEGDVEPLIVKLVSHKPAIHAILRDPTVYTAPEEVRKLLGLEVVGF